MNEEHDAFMGRLIDLLAGVGLITFFVLIFVFI